MTTDEFAPALQALDRLEAAGRIAGARLRAIIADDALGCPRHRREYCAVVVKLLDAPVGGDAQPTEAEFGVFKAHDYPCCCRGT